MDWLSSARDPWSVKVAQWGGVPIRIHYVFLPFVLLTVWYAHQVEQQVQGEWAASSFAVLLLGVHFVSVLAHEAAHWVATKVWGGNWQSLVITPLGGMGRYDAPLWPARELAVVMAGPTVHLAVVVVGVTVLAAGGHWYWLVLHPFQPGFLVDGPSWVVATSLVVWTNWMLLIMNLIPAFPADGRRAIRVWLCYRFPKMENQRVTCWVSRVARLTSVLLVLVAVLLPADILLGLPRIALICLGMLTFFGTGPILRSPGRTQTGCGDTSSIAGRTGFLAMQDAARHNGDAAEPCFLPQADFGEIQQGWAGGETLSSGLSDTVRLQEAAKRERDELVDELLARIGRDGIQSLTPEELQVLRRAHLR